MKFDPPLIRGILQKRYKRFLCDVELESGEIVAAHCPNPGAMLGLTDPGTVVFLSPAHQPNRKLPYTWEMVQIAHPVYGNPTVQPTYVGMNTMNPNRLVLEALQSGFLNSFLPAVSWKAEVRISAHSRVDFALYGEDVDKPHFAEVKNVHLIRRKGLAEFPDCVTARGAKHLIELAQLAREGVQCTMVYIVQRSDCESFQVAIDLDKHYGQSAEIARKAGVKSLAFGCDVSPHGIQIHHLLNVLD
jgi:sugar fermentation stimulation protein A